MARLVIEHPTLRMLIAWRGLTGASDLARRSGLAVLTVGDFCIGKRPWRPRPDTADRMARGLWGEDRHVPERVAAVYAACDESRRQYVEREGERARIAALGAIPNRPRRARKPLIPPEAAGDGTTQE